MHGEVAPYINFKWLYVITEKGYFLYASRNRQNARARFLSPYFSSNNTCVEFFHQIRSGRLVVSQGLRGKTEEVWSRGPTISTDWDRGYVALPDGYIRVTIEAIAKDGKVNIALDDVKISKCKPSKFKCLNIYLQTCICDIFMKLAIKYFIIIRVMKIAHSFKSDSFMFNLYYP